MQLIDSHCHLDLEPLSAQLPAVLARAATNHITHMLCVSINLEDHPRILDIATAHPHIFASVGVHPNTTDAIDPSVDQLLALTAHPKVIAIGETGLDYYRTEDRPAWQRDRFARHIEAAKRAHLPLIVHTRSAAADTMDILETMDAGTAGGIMHCFAEDWHTARRALDIGFYISFSGIITFKNAEPLRQVARQVPLTSTLIETDAPYLAPTPYRGKVNEPSYLLHTAQRLSALHTKPLEHIATVTTANFFHLFPTTTSPQPPS